MKVGGKAYQMVLEFKSKDPELLGMFHQNRTSIELRTNNTVGDFGEDIKCGGGKR